MTLITNISFILINGPSQNVYAAILTVKKPTTAKRRSNPNIDLNVMTTQESHLYKGPCGKIT